MKFLVNQETKIHIKSCVLKPAEDADKRTATLHLAVELTAELVRSAPKFVQESFRAVKSADTGILSADLAKDIELQQIEFFLDPRLKTGQRFRTKAADLKKLVMSREEAETGPDKIMLHMNMTQPLEKHLWSWIYDTLGKQIFATFFETQGELELENEEEEPEPTKAKAAKKAN